MSSSAPYSQQFIGSSMEERDCSVMSTIDSHGETLMTCVQLRCKVGTDEQKQVLFPSDL